MTGGTHIQEEKIGPFTLRGLALAATALAAGLGAGRSYLQTRVEAQKQSAVDAALIEARAQVKTRAEAYISASLSMFWRRMLVKTVLLGLVAGGLWLLGASQLVSGWSVAGVLAAFLIWDAVVTIPTARIILASLRRSGFKPRAALASAVSANVFAVVMERAGEQSVSRTQTLLLAAAGTNKDAYKTDVAQAVSTLAAEASWQDLRPFLLLAGAKFGSLLALYSAYVWTVLFLAR